MGRGLVLAALCLAASPAFAKVTKYECTFPQERASGGGWVPEIVVVEDDADKETVTVFDPVIRHFIGNPIAATRGEETRARITYNWKFTTRNKGQAAIMFYRLTYFKDGKPAKMLVQPGGYDNKYTAEGACKASSR